MSKFLKQIGAKKISKEELAQWVVDRPVLIAELFKGLDASDASTRYGSEKVLRILSNLKPRLLMKHFDQLAENLRHDVKILRLGAINVIANLVSEDTANRFDEVFEIYFLPIRQEIMIPAANVVKGAAKIAISRPDLADRIAAEILRVQSQSYETTECKNVLLGKAVESLHGINELCSEQTRRAIALFAKKLSMNSRPATAKKAMALHQAMS